MLFFLRGWIMLALMLIWPKIFFLFIWMALYFIFEPVNIWLGQPLPGGLDQPRRLASGHCAVAGCAA